MLVECPSERHGDAPVAERRFDGESGSLADGGELAMKAQAQRLGPDNGQRSLWAAAARSKGDGAEADESLRRANAIVLGEAIVKWTEPFRKTAERIRLGIGCRVGHSHAPSGRARGWFARHEDLLSEPCC